MKDSPWVAITLLLGNLFIILLIQFGLSSFQYNNIRMTLNEAARVAGINSIDKSARVDEELFLIGKDAFENKVETLFKRNTALNVDDVQFSFDYLDNSTEFTETDVKNIKAVKIKIELRQEQYSITYIANINDLQ